MIIKRTLRGTAFEAIIELDDIEYAHLQLIEGQRPDVTIPFNRNVARRMAALAEHFEEGLQVIISDGAQDAKDLVF